MTWNCRGYPPSGVPEDPTAYSQEHLVADLLGLLDYLQIAQAHLVGLSMGGSLVLAFALAHPERCRSIVAAGAGSGTTGRERFERDVHQVADTLLTQGMAPSKDGFGAAHQTVKGEPLGCGHAQPIKI